jgi:small GTP-binding protein
VKRTVLNIVFTGHVDHGKSTLIGRLLIDTGSLPDSKVEEVKKVSRELGKEAELAYVTDYLKEEREQNITIDTTQVHFQTGKRAYVIIDAPGHVEFIKNMITGTSQAEAAVLIVDASEGVLEQTRRHAYLIHLLGLKKLVVVINKMDLVGYSEKRYIEVKDELARFLGGLSLEPLYTIPVSAREGENVSVRSRKMQWHRGGCFLKALDSLKQKKLLHNKLPLRFPVQDVYEVDGESVVVGRIVSGTIEKGQEVVELPSGRLNSIESIKIFDSEKQRAEAFESIGVILQEPSLVKRGSVLVPKEDIPELNITLRASVFWMSDPPWGAEKQHRLQCSTQEVPCRVEKISKKMNSSTMELVEKDKDRLHKYEVGDVLIRTENPILTESFMAGGEFGRFVIKDEGRVAGVGIVI